MFGRDAAAKVLHDRQHFFTDNFTFALEVINVQRIWTQYVEMQIAVTNVTKPDDLKLRITSNNRRLHRVEEIRYLADRDGDIVFVRRIRRDGL